MTDSEKIDKIFSKVSKIETELALLKKSDDGVTAQINKHEGQLRAIEEVIAAYRIEKAKLIGIAVASGTILTAIGSFVLWLISLFHKNG